MLSSWLQACGETTCLGRNDSGREWWVGGVGGRWGLSRATAAVMRQQQECRDKKSTSRRGESHWEASGLLLKHGWSPGLNKEQDLAFSRHPRPPPHSLPSLPPPWSISSCQSRIHQRISHSPLHHSRRSLRVNQQWWMKSSWWPLVGLPTNNHPGSDTDRTSMKLELPQRVSSSNRSRRNHSMVGHGLYYPISALLPLPSCVLTLSVLYLYFLHQRTLT